MPTSFLTECMLYAYIPWVCLHMSNLKFNVPRCRAANIFWWKILGSIKKFQSMYGTTMAKQQNIHYLHMQNRQILSPILGQNPRLLQHCMVLTHHAHFFMVTWLSLTLFNFVPMCRKLNILGIMALLVLLCWVRYHVTTLATLCPCYNSACLYAVLWLLCLIIIQHGTENSHINVHSKIEREIWINYCIYSNDIHQGYQCSSRLWIWLGSCNGRRHISAAQDSTSNCKPEIYKHSPFVFHKRW